MTATRPFHAHRLFALIFAGGFLIGGANHARDIVQGGLLPYHSVPMSINVFWTALCPLDFAAAALVRRWRALAVLLGLLILLADVAANSWLAYFSGLHVASFEPLQVQTLFLGFVLGGGMFVRGRGNVASG
jgi:hypothetical protein